jgi:hypothetical protein
MLAPHWIDNIIEKAVEENNADAVLYALTHSNQLLAAVASSLERAHRPQPKNTMAPSPAQIVREAIVQTVETADA